MFSEIADHSTRFVEVYASSGASETPIEISSTETAQVQNLPTEDKLSQLLERVKCSETVEDGEAITFEYWKAHFERDTLSVIPTLMWQEKAHASARC